MTGCDRKRLGAGHGAHDVVPSTSLLSHCPLSNRFLLRLKYPCRQHTDVADVRTAEPLGLAQGCHTNTADAEHHQYSPAVPASSLLLPTMKPSRMHLLYMRACVRSKAPTQLCVRLAPQHRMIDTSFYIVPDLQYPLMLCTSQTSRVSMKMLWLDGQSRTIRPRNKGSGVRHC